MVQHVVCESDLSLLVTNDWELEVCARDLVDVLDPSSVALDRIGGQSDQLDTSFCEFWFELRECAQLSRAHRSVVFGVREKDDPFVTNELVEVDGTSSRLSLEVGSNRA